MRRELLEARRRMAFEDVYALSLEIQKRFLGSSFYKKAGSIALYAAFQNEVLTGDIFRKAMEDSKKVFFPRVVRDEKRLSFHRVAELGELEPGAYDVPEPKTGGVDMPELDMIVLPGIAFDEKGARIGYGKGYYDITLERLGCPAVALAFDFQVVKGEIPVKAHDVPMRAIFTEKRILEIP